jgi:signal peptidase I
MARLLTLEEAHKLHPTLTREWPEAPLYLELSHHPTLKNAHLIRDEYGRVRPDLATSISLLPVQQEEMNALMSSMTTCRFVVQDGLATRYGSHFHPTSAPHMPNVPNGTYEFVQGIGYKILWGGISYRLPQDHPLFKIDAQNVQMLYNLGIEMDTHFTPSGATPSIPPSRYAYFLNHDLHLLGAPIFKKGSPALIQFHTKEYQKQALSSTRLPYYAFDDAQAPLTNSGELDTEFIRKYGLKVPEGMYLVLGDNHPMSADSRVFGFVPQENLRGGPSFLFWPFGPRWGRLPQPELTHLTIPNIAVWSFFLIIALSSTIYIRRKYNKPLKF